jgi:hypothetical protein
MPLIYGAPAQHWQYEGHSQIPWPSGGVVAAEMTVQKCAITDSSICSWEIAESFQWAFLQLNGEMQRFSKLKEIWRLDD